MDKNTVASKGVLLLANLESRYRMICIELCEVLISKESL